MVASMGMLWGRVLLCRVGLGAPQIAMGVRGGSRTGCGGVGVSLGGSRAGSGGLGSHIGLWGRAWAGMGRLGPQIDNGGHWVWL